MNDWTSRVIRYLEERSKAGDKRAGALLARGDKPKRAPTKPQLASLTLQDERARQAENAEADAIAKMHDDVWEWNLADGGSRCDCGCGVLFRHIGDGELDHWRGRKIEEPHHRNNGWRLLSSCHNRKTDSVPPSPRRDRDGLWFTPTWNEVREDYCRRAAIPFHPRKERAA